MDDTLKDLVCEITRQDQIWGEQNHSVSVWSDVLMEEVGERSSAILHMKFGLPEKKTGHALNYYEECIQIAAVAIQAAACFQRNLGKGLD